MTRKLEDMKRDVNHQGHLKINEVKIADIVFAFNNTKLIELLRKRGTAIMY